MCLARLLTERASEKAQIYKKLEARRVERHPRRPCFAACTRSRDENPWTATANERRGRAVIGRYYKRGHRCPGTVSRTSDRAARGCADISKAAEDATKVESSDEGKENAEDDIEKETAATKIQAAFRGHHARKSLRVSETASKTKTDEEPSEPTQEQLQQEFSADDKDLLNAAKKIQATFRGHMSRKEQATAAAKSAMNMVESATAKIEEKMQDAVHELEGIDLADPDLHKAATKIQASFRGHKVRQEVNIHTTADDIKK